MARIRALALYSGGLDSILACRVIINQVIKVDPISDQALNVYRIA